METLEQVIYKHALKNAKEYGECHPKNIVGKIIAEFPASKDNIKDTMRLISEITTKINQMSKEEIEQEMTKHTYYEKKENTKVLSIPNAEDGKVVTRLPPEPNAPGLHIGHAKAMYLDSEIAQIYNGKCILRFDDTNPEKETQEYVTQIKNDLNTLKIKWDEEHYASDYMPKMYELGEQLLRQDNAYVCTCDGDTISLNRKNKQDCDCRTRNIDQNIERWKQMLSGDFDKGQVIMRFKGDMASNNTAMRDPTMFRIIKTSHYRQGTKYNVWPSYDFEGSVMDSVLGITHPIRSKEYELRDEIYYKVLEVLNLRKPTLITISRLNVADAELSKRKLNKLVEDKLVSGWDDPRLPTIKGLVRRGILTEAIKSFVLQFGISKVESKPSLNKLYVENKKLLDHITIRKYFVLNPIKVTVLDSVEKEVQVYNHPQDHTLGSRKINVNRTFYIPKTDFDNLNPNQDFRLKEVYNVKVMVKNDNELVVEFDGEEVRPNQKIQWVTDNHLECEVVTLKPLFNDKGEYNSESINIVKGYCETSCDDLNIGDIVQFERYGFVKLDGKLNGKLTFIKCHN